ncbi:catalase [Luteibacter rhizovicinus]|uniref:Catalase-related peroxidase n=1 Tax=Luteibacter rhizovicinus TaxID=242606 RepID=A0A4R3YLM2_9GAMM|nr:catalase family peroxidase [Luteibacter rhizovicinus]TCV92358.1 catalase [Luteibacter rhizovicinus]
MPIQTPSRPPLDPRQRALRFAAIGGVAIVAVAAFGYVGGWLAPHRLTPERIVDALQHNGGDHPGFRRNHAKGVCVTGVFEGSGAAANLSKASVFEQGQQTPVLGRLALPGGNPYAPDGSIPIRSFALRLALPDGQQWRTGMNAMPVFPVSTPQAFYDQQLATAADPSTGKPDPRKVAAFFAAHPETKPFLTWVKTAKPSASYATEAYSSINSFYFVDGKGDKQAVRWALIPEATDAAPGPAGDPDYLAADLVRRLAAGPLRWHLLVTLAAPGDAIDDAAQAWSPDHKQIDAGTLTVQATEPQDSGPCRDVNYDPLVLPAGIEGSNDPLLAARSAAYADSYRRRTTEEARGLTKESAR